MTQADATLTVAVDADTRSLDAALREAERLSRGFGRAMGGALEGAAVRGRTLTQVLQGMGQRLSEFALRSAMRPLEGMVSGLAQQALSGLLSAVTPFARGGVVPFAGGGVVSAPTFFPMAGGRMGLMGEAGPEAILPLARGPDGRLGVRGGGGGGAVNVSVQIATPDAESFRRSEAQVSAALARAVARGRRGL